MNRKGQHTERECDQSMARDTEDLSTSSAIIMQIFKTKKELKEYKPQNRFLHLCIWSWFSATLLDREFHLLNLQRAAPMCSSWTTVGSESDGNTQWSVGGWAV